MEVKKKKMHTLIKYFLIVLAILLVIALTYVAYVFMVYYRIEDNLVLSVEGNAANSKLTTEESYTIVTQNMGFGAYTADFTFFMDGGTQSWGNSKESVASCIEQGIDTIRSFDPDFVLLQEVDSDSTRSYHIDQQEMFRAAYEDFNSATAINYHSVFLMYPLYQPHGASNSGIMTLSQYEITSALRRSLPISTGFSKILDLDRCYSISRIPVDNGKELILINIHSSAYGGSDEIRAGQMGMLFADMQAEYEKGNYVICGGDFNHDFTGDSVATLNKGIDVSKYGWAQPFPAEMIPQGFSRCMDYDNEKMLPTSRNCDLPYGENSFVIILDGYIVSDNVEAEYLENYWTGFVYSDHSPVVMKFRLK